MNNQELDEIEHKQKQQQQDNRYTYNHNNQNINNNHYDNDDDDHQDHRSDENLKQEGEDYTENRERANYFSEMTEKQQQQQQYPQKGVLGKDVDDIDTIDGTVQKPAVASVVVEEGATAVPMPTSASLPFDMNIFLQKVFGLMFIALLITAGVSLLMQHIHADDWLNANPGVFIFLLIFEVGLVFGAVILLPKLSYAAAVAIFFLYAILNGVTLTPIVSYYTASSVAFAFFSASSIFLGMGLYGYFTKKNLDSWGSILIGALWGLIVAGLINIFFRSSTMQFVISICGVVVFSGLTAYDVQMLKELGEKLGNKATTDESSKYAVFGALNLYLDFINLFLYLLQLLGKSNN